MVDLLRIQKQVLYILTQVQKQLRSNRTFKQVQEKSGRTDLVTERDLNIEQLIIQYLKQQFPQARFVSEEGFGDQVHDVQGLIFYVDPIDGTMNFVKLHDQFVSMIGVYFNGNPVFGAIADVMADKLYYGGPKIGSFMNGQPLITLTNSHLNDGLVMISNRFLSQTNYQKIRQTSCGLRIYGSAGISFLHLINQQEILYISQLQPWDLAAGWALGCSLGLQVQTIDDTPINMLQSQTVIIGTERATKEAKKLLS